MSHHFVLCDELTGIELCNHAFQNFTHRYPSQSQYIVGSACSGRFGINEAKGKVEGDMKGGKGSVRGSSAERWRFRDLAHIVAGSEWFRELASEWQRSPIPTAKFTLTKKERTGVSSIELKVKSVNVGKVHKKNTLLHRNVNATFYGDTMAKSAQMAGMRCMKAGGICEGNR